MANENRQIVLRKRLIYAGDLWHKTFDCEEPGDFRKAIENAPSVDAVEVVRCKDCEHCVRLGGPNCPDVRCDYLHTDYINLDDFCSYGERRAPM